MSNGIVVRVIGSLCNSLIISYVTFCCADGDLQRDVLDCWVWLGYLVVWSKRTLGLKLQASSVERTVYDAWQFGSKMFVRPNSPSSSSTTPPLDIGGWALDLIGVPIRSTPRSFLYFSFPPSLSCALLQNLTLFTVERHRLSYSPDDHPKSDWERKPRCYHVLLFFCWSDPFLLPWE